MRLKDKVAIVTGSGSGFGEGIVERFAEEGCKLVVNDVNADNGNRVTDALNAAHGDGTAVFVRADVTSDEEVGAMVAEAVERFGRLDVLVNNAGISHRNMPMLDIDEDIVDRMFDVNVKAIWLAAKHAIPHFRKVGGGSIINNASTAGLRPRPGLSMYNASKGAAITLTKSMAVEFAPENIRVNALCPVAGETPLLATFMGEDTPEMRAKFRASIPIGRLSTPRDIANAALYLASDDAAFITGVAMEVDGGRCI
ncbi:SDR family oxidoreductase [Amorphus coralli]|uniref:SDR family oxidoreductase n=1 Tax=Amorphus coralli TaxID=340680 RepID=UPI00036BF68E|nr:SDR family oxidoreductase [Amorphus coralli]